MPKLPTTFAQKKPAPVVADGPLWNTTLATITIIDEGPKKVQAKCLAFFAVHAGYEPEHKNLWALTHIPSGLRVLLTDTETDAVRIGEFLRSKFYLAFLKKTQAETTIAVPPWVVRWLRHCNTKRQWTDPKPFEG